MAAMRKEIKCHSLLRGRGVRGTISNRTAWLDFSSLRAHFTVVALLPVLVNITGLYGTLLVRERTIAGRHVHMILQ